MNVDDLGQSKYLSKSDCGERGILLTIKRITKETIGRGKDAEQKFVLHFEENVKPMVLNKVNGRRIGQMTGIYTKCEVGWIGTKIVAYNDPDVEFGGEVKGGIRVRAPRNQASQVRPPVQQPQPVPQDSFPAGYDEQGGGMDGDPDGMPPDGDF